MSIELIGLLVTFLLSIFIVIGALIAFLANKKQRITDFSLGLAFSVIIMLVVLDLLPEIIEQLGLRYIWLFLIFTALGYFILRLLDHYVPDHHHSGKMNKQEASNNLAHIGLISSIALIIHNIVEGMVVYSTVLTDVKTGLMLAIGIGFHNLPLGMVIATTFYQGNQKSKKVWIVLGVVALSTLFGGGISLILNNGLFPEWMVGCLLSLTFGMLLFILISEIYPRIKKTKYTGERNIGLLLGIILMLLSLMI